MKVFWHDLYWTVKCWHFNMQTKRAIWWSNFKKHWSNDWCFFTL